MTTPEIIREIQKIYLQPKKAVNTLPRIRAMINPKEPTAPQIPRALDLILGSLKCKAMCAWADGIV